METKNDIFNLMKKVNFIFLSNEKNKTIVELYINFTEKYLLIQDLVKEFDPSDSEEKKLYLANAVMLLIKQCEILYEAIKICVSNKFDEIISKTVEKMETTKEYKAIIKDFLLQLLNNNKIKDLAYLLVLLKNVEIRKQTSPIIKEYVPKVITFAAAETVFYSQRGLIKGEEKLVFNPDYILVNVCSSMALEAQKEALEHELTHIIVYPSTTVAGIDNHQQMEDAVENYLTFLNQIPVQENTGTGADNKASKSVDSLDGEIDGHQQKENAVEKYLTFLNQISEQKKNGADNNDSESGDSLDGKIDEHHQKEDAVENHLTSLNQIREQKKRGADNNASKSVVSVKQIISNLKQQGFKILKQDNELIAFCEERNIMFFCRDMDHILQNYEGDKMAYYQQPYITNDGTCWIAFLSHFENCKKVKTKFPLFTESNYLRIYNLTDKDSPFISSMKRIASIPELYNAVGYENQQLIEKVISENTKTSKR